MQLERRPAGEGDIPFLLSLRRETMDDYLKASGVSTTDEAHLVRLMHHFDCAEVLSWHGRPVGLLKLRRLPDEWQLIQIQLSRELQGQGFGRALLEALLADAAAAGAAVKLGVLKTNPAKRLYERLGFEVVGEDTHEYSMRRSA